MTKGDIMTGTKLPDDLDIRIASRLKQARLYRGFTQADLASYIGVSFQQIQKYENGQNRISASTLGHCADYLNVPIEHFYHKKPPKVPLVTCYGGQKPRRKHH